MAMSIVRSLRLASVGCRNNARHLYPALGTRTFATVHRTDWKDREVGSERDFINRQEQEILKSLLARMEKAMDPEGKQAKSELNSVLDKEGIQLNEKVIEELVKWKYAGASTLPTNYTMNEMLGVRPVRPPRGTFRTLVEADENVNPKIGVPSPSELSSSNVIEKGEAHMAHIGPPQAKTPPNEAMRTIEQTIPKRPNQLPSALNDPNLGASS